MGTEPSSRDGDRVGLRFGPYELDLRSAELWKAGLRCRLQLQPFKLLALLASRPGELLSREELRQELWPDGTYVDFEQALNFCIRQIRAALGDQAATPRYVETLPKRGYRFIAPVEPIRGQRLGDGGNGTPHALLVDTPLDVPAPPVAVGFESPYPRVDALRRRPRTIPLRTAVFGALGLAALAAALAWVVARPSGDPAPGFHRITFRRGSVNSARFAPEGQVVYTAAWEGGGSAPYLAHLTARETRPLDLKAYRVLSVSRTGEIAFGNGKGVLSRAPLAGGPPKQVLEDVISADGLPDGSEFAVARRGKDSRVRIEFPIGTVLATALMPSHLRLCPTGEYVAFLDHPVIGDDRGNVVVVDRAGQMRTLSANWSSIEGLAWSPRGDEVWFTAAREGADSALYAVDLKGHERLVFSAPGRLVVHDIAPDGRVLLERNTLCEEIRFKGPADAEERDLSWFDISRAQDLSRDGLQLLIGESGEGGGREYGVFLRRTDGALPVRIGTGQAVALSPDGAWAMAIPLNDRTRLDLLPTGAGEIRSIREPAGREYQWASWTPDGKSIVYTALENGRARVFVRAAEGGAPRAVTPPGVGVWMPAVSPDSARLVAWDHGWFLYPLAGGVVRPVAIPEDRRPFGWADAETLFLRAGEVPVSVERFALDSGKREPWKTLAPADRAGVLSIPAVRVSGDGSAYAYSFHRRLSDLYVVDAPPRVR